MATQTEAAEHLDVVPRTFRRLQKEGVLPPSKGRGSYDLDACRTAYIRHLRGVASGQHNASPEALDLMQERARKERAQADKTEFDLSVSKKEYVHISHLEQVLERFASAAAGKLESVGARLRQKYPDLKSRHVDGIRKEIAELGNSLANLRPF